MISDKHLVKSCCARFYGRRYPFREAKSEKLDTLALPPTPCSAIGRWVVGVAISALADVLPCVRQQNQQFSFGTNLYVVSRLCSESLLSERTVVRIATDAIFTMVTVFRWYCVDGGLSDG